VAATDDIWDAERWPPGWRVHHIVETGSTNADLLAAAERGLVVDRTVLVADHQTAGRGRLDRLWDAPPGTNLLVSLLFDTVPDPPAELTQRMALAACAAAERLVPALRVRVKWPNDLVIDGRKVAGILAQRSGDLAVVGLGFNVSWSPADAADLGGAVTPSALLARMLVEFDALPTAVAGRHRQLLVTLGQRIRAELPGGSDVVGRADDIDDDGRLIVVDAAGGRHVLDAADIVHLRPEGR
jgi:BirA family biotin operon repressor/biotin-[acetyl-CoA-carboxylase] ligase